jgi:hypothetical protein
MNTTQSRGRGFGQPANRVEPIRRRPSSNGPVELRFRVAVFLVLLAVTAAAALAVGVTPARSVVVGAAPVWPIPAAAAPPPIPNLPAASEVPPPSDQVADPFGGRACTGWERQSNYGGLWPTGSSWWEYRCSYADTQGYDPECGGGACNAWCYSCYEVTTEWTDYVYWDGSNAVFYGEAYSVCYFYYYWGGGCEPTVWWDSSTARWYR